MPEHPTRADVDRLADVRASWCVTIYCEADIWLRGNSDRASAESQIRSAVDALERSGAPARIIASIRGRLDRILAPTERNGGHRWPGTRWIGIFVTEQDAELFGLTSSPAPWVEVADRFLVGPLLEGALSLVPPACVVAISENEVRLLDVTAYPPESIPVPGLPHDLKGLIDLDLTGDRDTLAHLRNSEDPKGRLREYAVAVDRAVRPVLERLGAVLVIAATEPLASIYRSSTSYSPVASSTVIGNHDGDSIYELADLAAPIIERHRREELDGRLARFAERPARGLVLTDVDTIADAARDGAIDTLFVDVNHRVSAEDGSSASSGLDVVDEIVRAALATDATIIPVHAGDLPTTDPVAAVLRYASATQPLARNRR